MRSVIDGPVPRKYSHPSEVDPEKEIVVRYRVDSCQVFLLERIYVPGSCLNGSWHWRRLSPGGLSEKLHTRYYEDPELAIRGVLNNSHVFCFDTTADLITWLAGFDDRL